MIKKTLGWMMIIITLGVILATVVVPIIIEDGWEIAAAVAFGLFIFIAIILGWFLLIGWLFD